MSSDIIRWGIATVLLALVAGCGSSSDQAAANPGAKAAAAASAVKADACSLLEDADVRAIMQAAEGEDVVHRVSGGVGESNCEWSTETPVRVVSVSVGNKNTAWNGLEPEPLFNNPPEPVAGMDGTAFHMAHGVVDFSAARRHNSIQVVSMAEGDVDAMAATGARMLQGKIENALR